MIIGQLYDNYQKILCNFCLQEDSDRTKSVTYQLHETAGEILKVTSFRIALEEVARLLFNRFRPEEQKTPNSISKQM
jgi:hypothetical protein